MRISQVVERTSACRSPALRSNALGVYLAFGWLVACPSLADVARFEVNFAKGPVNTPDIIILDSDYGYQQFRAHKNSAKVIVASDASWIVDNEGTKQNRYPFLVDKGVAGVKIYGGRIHGVVPLEQDWAEAYTNSAAVMVRDVPRAEIHDWRIRKAWDGIRIAANSHGFTINNVRMSNIRDDAIENDHGAGGKISNSLFDRVFSGLSMTKKKLPDMTSHVVTLDNVVMRMGSFPFDGRKTHGSPFKIIPHSPSLKVYDSVIAIEDVNHIGQSRTRLAWSKTIEAANNYLLNLSDAPFPEDYPLPGAGWTVLQGQAARDHWLSAKADWRAVNADLQDASRIDIEHYLLRVAPPAP